MTILQARNLSGLSCKDVANYLEITEWEYRLLENSPWRFNLEQVILLLSILNCDYYAIDWGCGRWDVIEKEFKRKEN